LNIDNTISALPVVRYCSSSNGSDICRHNKHKKDQKNNKWYFLQTLMFPVLIKLETRERYYAKKFIK